MNTVNILASAYYKGAIHSVSSTSGDNKADNVLNDDIESFWCTNKSHNATGEYIVIDYGVAVAVNVIELLPSPSGKSTFPSDFRLESSADGSNWEVIKTENRYSLDEDRYRLLLPMNAFQFLKLYIIKPKRIAAKYFSEIGRIKAGIQGASAITASSCSSYEHDPSNLLMNDSAKYWESETSNTPSRQWIEIDMGRDFPLAHIGLISTSSAELFPEQFSIESSEDRKVWTTIAELKRFKAEANRSYIFGMYQFSARYIRILCTTVQSSKQNYCAQIAQICAYASLPSDSHFHVNTAVQYATIFQPGIVTLAGDGDTTPSTVVQANDSRLRDASTIFKGIVQLAADGSSEKGLVVQASDSRLSPATELKCGIVRLAYDREMVEGVAVQSIDSRLKEATENSFGIVKLCPDGEYVENSVVKGNDSRIQKATEKKFGIVRLADDGEDSEFSVVQGNDRRLKDATIVARGIVELAEDGEDKEGVAVQGNDRRLKDATTHSKGIVELAEDGEDKEGVAVQGNDRRLKDATTHSKGIVELAEDGEDKEGMAVQGNDRRLKDATVHSKGIVELAEDGEDKEGVAVQGNDRRLKDATTHSKGIVELAEDGEDKEGVAVQGNDRRLKDATTHSRGIVELAEDGEDREGVAVQGNDRRLKDATVDNPGIVTLAKHGENRTLHAVQSDDPRLYDKREPLPHTHDYAPIVHAYHDHTGTIAIIAERSEEFIDIVPPTHDSAVIYGKNVANKDNAIGVAGIVQSNNGHTIKAYGVLGHASMCGVRGQSQGNSEGIQGCGVMGLSRFGAGGVFVSEHNYSLVADGYGTIAHYDDTVHLVGNGKALYANGESYFNGTVSLNSDNKEYYASIVEMFETDDKEYISPGDVLVVSEQGNAILSRSRNAFNKGVIGVVAGNPVMVINNASSEKKLYPVALTGSVLCKVDARQKGVKPGDLLVTSDMPGCAMPTAIDSFDKIGTVFAKALSALDSGVALIPVMIWKM